MGYGDTMLRFFRRILAIVLAASFLVAALALVLQLRPNDMVALILLIGLILASFVGAFAIYRWALGPIDDRQLWERDGEGMQSGFGFGEATGDGVGSGRRRRRDEDDDLPGERRRSADDRADNDPDATDLF